MSGSWLHSDVNVATFYILYVIAEKLINLYHPVDCVILITVFYLNIKDTFERFIS